MLGFCFCLSWRVLTLRFGDELNGDSWDSYCPDLCALPFSWQLLPSCNWHNRKLRESSFTLPHFMPASAHAGAPAHKLPWLGGKSTSNWAMTAVQVEKTRKEKGWPAEGGTVLLSTPSRATGGSSRIILCYFWTYRCIWLGRPTVTSYPPRQEMVRSQVTKRGHFPSLFLGFGGWFLVFGWLGYFLLQLPFRESVKLCSALTKLCCFANILFTVIGRETFRKFPKRKSLEKRNFR